MSYSPDDHDLRSLFDDLRRDEAKRIPPFRRATSGAPAILPAVLRAIAAVLLVAISLLLLRRQPQPEPEIASITFSAPTDFLLELPQSELLRTTPSIGAPIPLPTTKGTVQ